MAADERAVRDWRDIARELSSETDAHRLRELSQELSEALRRANPNSTYELIPKMPLKRES